MPDRASTDEPVTPRRADSGGWGPETRVTAGRSGQPPEGSTTAPPVPARAAGRPLSEGGSQQEPASPTPAPVPPPGVRAVLRQAARAQRSRAADDAPAQIDTARTRRAPAEPKGPGLPGWAAVLVLAGIAGLGGLIDGVGGSSLKGLFAIGLIVGSLVAILIVRRREMFPVIVAPPLIYFGASAVLLYVRSGGLSDRAVLIDAASNWLVYGFPAIAGASAVVLVVAGIRLIVRR